MAQPNPTVMVRLPKRTYEAVKVEARRRGLSATLCIGQAVASWVIKAQVEKVPEPVVIPGQAPEDHPERMRKAPGSFGLALKKGRILAHEQVVKPGTPELTDEQAKKLLQKSLPSKVKDEAA